MIRTVLLVMSVCVSWGSSRDVCNYDCPSVGGWQTVQEWAGDRLSKSGRVTDCPSVGGWQTVQEWVGDTVQECAGERLSKSVRVTDCPRVCGWQTVQECVGDRLCRSVQVTVMFFLGARPKSVLIVIWKWAAGYFYRPVFWVKCQSRVFNFHSDNTYQTLSQSHCCSESGHCVLCTCEGFIWVHRPQHPTGPECLSRLR